MSDIDLPPIYVGAQPEFGSNPVISLPPTSPTMPPAIAFSAQHGAQKVFANGANIFPSANKGLVIESMIHLLEGLNGLPQNKIQEQLMFHAKVSRAMAAQSEIYGNVPKFESASLTELSYGKAWFDYAPRPMNTSGTYDFFGTPIMSAAGIYYWLFGGGQTRNLQIGSLNLSVVPSDFKPITNALAANGPGTYQINEAFSINTFDHFLNWWAGFLIGRVSGNISGSLTIAADGSYSFVGGYTLNPDKFDADVSNRSWFQEKATDFLRLLGSTFGHADYQINIIGTQHVEFSGRK